jgi:hypothetical protein
LWTGRQCRVVCGARWAADGECGMRHRACCAARMQPARTVSSSSWKVPRATTHALHTMPRARVLRAQLRPPKLPYHAFLSASSGAGAPAAPWLPSWHFMLHSNRPARACMCAARRQRRGRTPHCGACMHTCACATGCVLCFTHPATWPCPGAPGPRRRRRRRSCLQAVLGGGCCEVRACVVGQPNSKWAERRRHLDMRGVYLCVYEQPAACQQREAARSSHTLSNVSSFQALRGLEEAHRGFGKVKECLVASTATSGHISTPSGCGISRQLRALAVGAGGRQ